MPNILNSKYNYERTKFVDADGNTRHSAGNLDAVARAMLLITPEQLVELAEANEIDLSKYKNPGLAKMALANRLRGLVRKDTAVKIGDVLVKKLDQKQPELKAPKPAPKTKPAQKVSRKKASNPVMEEEQDAAE